MRASIFSPSAPSRRPGARVNSRQRRKSTMINKELQDRFRQLANLVVTPLAASRVTPNMLTVVGLLLSMLTGAVIGLGTITLGGALLLFAGIFDMFDGAL